MVEAAEEGGRLGWLGRPLRGGGGRLGDQLEQLRLHHLHRAARRLQPPQALEHGPRLSSGGRLDRTGRPNVHAAAAERAAHPHHAAARALDDRR